MRRNRSPHMGAVVSDADLAYAFDQRDWWDASDPTSGAGGHTVRTVREMIKQGKIVLFVEEYTPSKVPEDYLRAFHKGLDSDRHAELKFHAAKWLWMVGETQIQVEPTITSPGLPYERRTLKPDLYAPNLRFLVECGSSTIHRLENSLFNRKDPDRAYVTFPYPLDGRFRRYVFIRGREDLVATLCKAT